MKRGRATEWMISSALAAALAAAFWIPSMPIGRGWFPIPLDDVYIHFDYARSIALGHPFEWIPDQGYSSGETAPLYALILSIGWLFGLRGALLGYWAAFLAVIAIASLLRSLHRLHVPWLVALLPLSMPIADWTLFSGMEVAIFAAVLGRAVEALQRTRGRDRERAQWRLGLWGVALVLLRPESVVLIAAFAVFAARGARYRSGLLAVLRASVPGALATGAIAYLNYRNTGTAEAAGAALKLLSSNPYMSEVDRARVYVENLVIFGIKGVRGERLWPIALVAMGSLVTRRRHLGAACIVSAFLWIALVTWNGNSPYHNFRYYVPALLMLGMAASFAIAALPSRAAIPVALLLCAIEAPKFPKQVTFFREASQNIRDQHVELGLRLKGRADRDTIVLVGDAGAIPYVADVHAIDALGLGGYRWNPFVKAAVSGEASVLEMIEDLPRDDRPTHLALYPNWFAGLSTNFGREVDRVTIANNVITGGPSKVLYEADWHLLAPPPWTGRSSDDPIVEEVDVADVTSERFAQYRGPQPNGGWTTFEVRMERDDKFQQGTGITTPPAKRFDGGRIIPDRQSESFVFDRRGEGAIRIHMRIDDDAHAILFRGQPMKLQEVIPGSWREATIEVPSIAAGETLTFESRGGYRDYHLWLERAR
jgi:hypothetical protein